MEIGCNLLTAVGKATFFFFSFSVYRVWFNIISKETVHVQPIPETRHIYHPLHFVFVKYGFSYAECFMI